MVFVTSYHILPRALDTYIATAIRQHHPHLKSTRSKMALIFYTRPHPNPSLFVKYTFILPPQSRTRHNYSHFHSFTQQTPAPHESIVITSSFGILYFRNSSLVVHCHSHYDSFLLISVMAPGLQALCLPCSSPQLIYPPPI